VPLQVNQLEKRVSVGEAVNNAVVQYGDPSLHVLPPAGTPVTALQIQPSICGHYEERTLEPGVSFKPVMQTYSLTNRSSSAMKIHAECDALWLGLSSTSLEIPPNQTATITATSKSRLEAMAPGTHVATIRFARADGQMDERRVGVLLQAVTLAMGFSFDAATQENRFEDNSLAIPPKNPWHDNSSLWLVEAQKGPHWNPFVKVGSKIEGYAAEPQGKVGGALRLSNPAKPWSRGIGGFAQWRGVSESFWFKVDALPEDKKKATISTAPFTLTVDSKGSLAFAKGAKAAELGTIQTGEWHFVQFRTDVAAKSVKARIDGKGEVTTAANIGATDAVTLGSFVGALDELKAWSGELSDAALAAEWTTSSTPFRKPAPAAPVNYLDDGVFRAPKEIPAVFDLANAGARLDLSKVLADHQLSATLREAPEWLELKGGVLALKPGVDFDYLDFGGYDFSLVLKAEGGTFAGRTCEKSLKVRIPVPEVQIRITRAADDMVAIVNARNRPGTPPIPLAKGVIRYTTDGSPVTDTSLVYDKPFKMEGKNITARFFYLGDYPMAPVKKDAQWGIPHDAWKAVAVSGDPGTAKAAANAMDGRHDTVWQNQGGTLPQFLSIALGKEETLSAVSVHSTIKDPDGRIKGFALYTSSDNKSWQKVKEGELESSPNAVKIPLDAPVKARFLKLEATSLHMGADMTVTEIDAIAATPGA
jgi:hypothetical protein